MRTVAIVNQKGGCGKTTTAINLAGVLARFGERTLLVDLDPQSHCAAGLAVPEDRIESHIGQAMLADPADTFDDARLLWKIRRNLDLAPSAMRLAGLEAARGGLADLEDRDERLANVLARWKDHYDVCLIDCPPSIGLLTYNALRAADEVLIPVETGFFAMQGAGRQINTIRALADRIGAETSYRLLVTMHDENSSLGNELLSELRRRFGDRVVPVVIRLDRRLKDAASMGQPIIEYAPSSIGAQDYSDLAAWLLGRPAPYIDTPAESTRFLEPRRPAPFAPPSLTEPKPFAAQGPNPPAQRSAASTAESVEVAVATRVDQPASSIDPVLSRAAELAARARQLLRRGEQLQDRLRRDPDVDSRSLEAGDTRQISAPTEPTEPAPGPIETADGVVFRHRAKTGARIGVAGEFNRWSPDATPLRFNARTGLYEGVAEIPPGRCEYRLVVDGVWLTDPGNPSVSVNPYGERNSVLVVVGVGAETPVYTEGAD